MSGTHSISFITVCSLLILLLQTRCGNLAPTHHLKVTVSGNTPTLIVTSSEVGATPRVAAKTSDEASLKYARNFTAKATAATPFPKWPQKSNQMKLKNKSQKLHYEKKREKAAKEKATVFYDKISLPATPAVSTIKSAEATTSEVASEERNYGATNTNAAIKLGANNELTVETAAEATVSTSTTHTSEKRVAVVSSISIAASTTTLGNLPHQTQTTTSSITSAAPTYAAKTMTMTTTPVPLTTAAFEPDTTYDTVASFTTIPNDEAKALPAAVSTETSKRAGKSEPAMKTASMAAAEQNPAAIAVITTEVESLSTAATAANSATESTSQNERVTTTSAATAAAITNSDSSSSTTPEITTEIPIKSMMPPHIERGEAEHGAIKLIDLEAHRDSISIDELRTKGAHGRPDVGGHDGVKQTKKKQLLAKHFTADTVDLASTAKPLEAEAMTATEQHNIEKPTLITPTMVPARNSYLGPIVMEELRLSATQQPHAKPTPQQHETSIESKLHDGRLVEIIAPTALLEHEATTMALGRNQPSYGTTKQPSTSTQQAVLSTTVFQVQGMAPQIPKRDEQRASKISDIQIEVYDNSPVALPELKFDSQTKAADLSMGTTKPPSPHPTTQERFTQYVVDRTETSTPDTVIDMSSKFLGIGKPEPAAIEIHINVSEGVTNQSEDLEFSYPQTENTDDLLLPNPLTSRPRTDRGDDILIVEIIDTGGNSTETQSPSSEREKPVFTFRTESNSDIDVKDVKFVASTDELFLADAKPPMPPPPPPPRGTSSDRDSDTIFYISNTEVKVGETPPMNVKTDDTHRAQMRRTRLENQFFPANYIASTHPNADAAHRQKEKNAHQPQMPFKHLYEEDIILSPLRNTADSVKIFRSSQSDGAAPLDVTYVGESVIEVEQSSGAGSGPTTAASASSAATAAASAQTQAADVVIQPAVLPEMAIGVPVIGELPPQIELKEIDFMPNEANQPRSGENNDIEENLSAGNNDLERLVESSIQYGGDLIDEAADVGGGFDGVEGSYPFGNVAAMRRKAAHRSAADYSHFQFHQSVNNLRKDELSIDVDVEAGSTKETPSDAGSENNTMAALTAENTVASAASQNASSAVVAPASNASRDGSVVGERNATKELSLAEQQRLQRERVAFTDLVTTIVAISMFIFIIAISIFAACVSKDIYAKWNGEGEFLSSENLPNGDVAIRDSVEPAASLKEESPKRHAPDALNANAFELVPLNEANVLGLPAPAANPTAKPSNAPHNGSNNSANNNSSQCSNSNSLNIVNEKQNADNFVNSRSKAAELPKGEIKRAKPAKPTQPNGVCPTISVPVKNNKYAGPNGSVTKMTLKNNHLIVETEERNDIARNARETKMHYNASDKDGVFVVEVARGIDSNMAPECPAADLVESDLSAFKGKATNCTDNKSPTRKFEDEPAVLNSHEQVQIHQPPTELHKSNTERSLHQIDEVEEESIVSPKPVNKAATVDEADFAKHANTGLSQSDLSSTSSNDSNKRYTYGNQELYTVEQTAYTASSPNGKPNDAALLAQVAEGKDEDRTSENGKGSEHTPEKTNNNEALNEVNAEAEIMNNDASVINGVDEKEDVEQAAKPAADEQATLEAAAETTPEPMDTSLEPTAHTEDDVGKDDSMSVSEVEVEVGVVVESVTSETDTTQKLNKEKIETSTATTANGLSQVTQPEAGTETDPEFAYDSLMSLPDPPTNDEMTQFSDFNGIETSQLDSLPPPPPALLVDENTNMPDIVAEIKSSKSSTQPPVVLNGNVEYDCNGHGNLNGHQRQQVTDRSSALPQLPPPTMEEVNSNGGIVPNSPLTPPESPPPSPPTPYSNGALGINEHVRAQVDVNVS